MIGDDDYPTQEINDVKSKKIEILTVIFGVFLIILTIVFILFFQVNPASILTISLFLGDLVIFVFFFIFLEKLLSRKEATFIKKTVDRKGNLEAKNVIISLFNKIFGKLENFPYIDEFKGRTKILLPFFGWILLVILFSISTIFRMWIVEFGSCGCLTNTVRQWTVYFGFNVFVLSMGAFIIYLTSKKNVFQIFKLSTFGVIIMIQVPAIVDYFINPSELPYHYIKWNDFLKAFSSFLLHPDLDYAVGIGHAVMLIFMMTFISLYVIVKRINYASQYNSKAKFFFISSRTFMSAFLIYFLVIISSITAPIIQTLLGLLLGSYQIEWVYFFLFDLYFIPLFLYILMEIWIRRKRNSIDTLKKSTQDLHDESIQQNALGNEEIRNSKTKLLLGILVLAFFFYYIMKILIIWINWNL